MDIRFTNHAKYRITEREISILQIEKTLKAPDSLKRGFENETVARRTFGKRILEFVYTKNKNKIIIITAYHI